MSNILNGTRRERLKLFLKDANFSEIIRKSRNLTGFKESQKNTKNPLKSIANNLKKNRLKRQT